MTLTLLLARLVFVCDGLVLGQGSFGVANNALAARRADTVIAAVRAHEARNQRLPDFLPGTLD